MYMATERLTKLKIKLLEDERPQYQIAAACGIHPSQLSVYALGQHPMSVRHLRALTKYFRCRQQDLLGWDEVEWEISE
jgi:hypothetical protein